MVAAGRCPLRPSPASIPRQGSAGQILPRAAPARAARSVRPPSTSRSVTSAQGDGSSREAEQAQLEPRARLANERARVAEGLAAWLVRRVPSTSAMRMLRESSSRIARTLRCGTALDSTLGRAQEAREDEHQGEGAHRAEHRPGRPGLMPRSCREASTTSASAPRAASAMSQTGTTGAHTSSPRPNNRGGYLNRKVKTDSSAASNRPPMIDVPWPQEGETPSCTRSSRKWFVDRCAAASVAQRPVPRGTHHRWMRDGRQALPTAALPYHDAHRQGTLRRTRPRIAERRTRPTDGGARSRGDARPARTRAGARPRARSLRRHRCARSRGDLAGSGERGLRRDATLEPPRAPRECRAPAAPRAHRSSSATRSPSPARWSRVRTTSRSSTRRTARACSTACSTPGASGGSARLLVVEHAASHELPPPSRRLVFDDTAVGVYEVRS